MAGAGAILIAIISMVGLWKLIGGATIMAFIGKQPFIILGVFLLILYWALKK